MITRITPIVRLVAVFGTGFQGMFHPSTRQPCTIARTYKFSTRQVTRQKASGTRQEAKGHARSEQTTPALSD
jgi:hypothetical protein